MLANTIGAMSSAALAGTLSKISLLKPHTYGPFLLVIMIIAAYQAGIRWGDVVAVVVIGLLAWLMQALKWPRPPLLIGFVLGTGAENYLWISVGRYGWTWLTEPSVVVIGVVIVITLFAGFTGVFGRLHARFARIETLTEPTKEPTRG